MKTIWFYGCSLTAGDELADEEFFPWKSQCKDSNEYHKRRSEIFAKDPKLCIAYQIRNKELSYPQKLQDSSDFRIFNRAENGSSLKTMIVKSLEDIILKKPVDFIVFQIPIHQREFYMRDTGFSSIQMSNPNLPKILDDYRKIKLKSHTKYQQSFEDLFDLVLYDSYLKNKKIPYMFLIMNETEYQYRVSDLKDTPYHYLISEFDKITDRFLVFNEPDCYERELAGHLNNNAHAQLSNLLKIRIENYYASLS